MYALLGAEFAGADFRWVAPAGRLDKASEGLLLLTNDSEWAARVLAPETHLNKTITSRWQGRRRRTAAKR